MQKETIRDFYDRTSSGGKILPAGISGLGHFNVFSRENCALVSPYSRRDFFKVSLILGEGKIHYADKWLIIDRPALLFSNPVVPYAWEATSALQRGWFCLFTDHFLHNGDRLGSLQESPFFKIGAHPVIFLNDAQLATVSAVFTKMMEEIDSGYEHKYDMLRNLLHVLIHEAMKMQPHQQYEHSHNASGRISSLFMELLERQFPIEGPDTYLKLKTANDYAKNLSVHVNSLNRSVKENTGRTTTDLIAGRIVQEAHALLHHTDWNIAEIAYGLGFEEPAYFTNFFKKHTGQTPNQLRAGVA
ncbi:MAG: helix-turn-helix domain-containing protein [Ferruginibacter sp.]